MRLYVRQLSEYGPVHPKKGVRYRECLYTDPDTDNVSEFRPRTVKVIAAFKRQLLIEVRFSLRNR